MLFKKQTLSVCLVVGLDVDTMAVRTATFRRFNKKRRQLRNKGIRIFGPNATVAEDLEPENVTISTDSKTAFLTLQENNALAIVDIDHAKVKKLVPSPYGAPAVDKSMTAAPR